MQQISLDEILSVVLSRMDGLAASEENLKSKFNIMGRVLYRKGLLSDQDVIDAIKEEHRLLVELGALKEEPDEEMVQAIADSMLQWLKGDVEAIKESMKVYEEKMRQAIAKEERKPRIDVAPSSALKQLDQMSGNKKGSKLIL
ncbi:hypothetical protein Dpep_1772 [Dethiosulfovibrio peptidovorans DSM 11002]|uniref:Uncharacterized protein n=1 Tax=Dethiosulfovibrio peptidovorans DSM 11002 TaxID=469381 RepID=D2Z8J9_9BACT|nr:hypothetical protein [Dethiosulfovibrio peptidovorans]EFC91796.1 hypothetical protein Dpep_1772 [Dethiosulfovibrio peptidovorans DSM 11002]